MASDTPTASTATSAPKPDAAPKAKPAKKPAAKQKAPKRGRKPGRKASGKGGGSGDGINKSEEVRKLAAATKASGNKPRPSVIVAELAKRGINVAMAQVSIVLKKMGFRPLRKRGKKSESVAAAGTPKAVARKTTAAGSISVDELLAAKKAVATLGGTEHALETIQALRRLEG
jgi:hypothetical protein